jgi:hypothetical protein
LKILTVSFLIAVYVGCSPVNFAKDSEMRKCQDFAASCIVKDGRDYFDETVGVGRGVADILIVDDNSASMSFEQAHLADRLANFVAGLEAQNTDYRIAITTTDISSPGNPARPINLNGALQDGKLIAFPNGEYFLTPSSGTLAQKDEWFRKTIQRNETLACESFIRANYGAPGYESAYNQNCPSGDERGVYAANLTIANNPNGFIRPNAYLSIIFLSDEDERSQLYYSGKDPSFALADLDQPQTLISNLAHVYGGKALSVNAFVTATQECLATQNNQMVVGNTSVVSGSYGSIYAEAVKKTGGILGDICESDYTTRLGQIKANILEHINDHTLACENPSDLVVTFTGQTGMTYTVSGRTVKLSQELNSKATARFQYSCPSL